MIDPKELKATKKFPTSIVEHPIFKSDKKIEKLFPSIGLQNCQEEITVDNSVNAKNSANALMREIITALDRRIINLDKFKKKLKKISDRRQTRFSNIQHLLNMLKSALSLESKNFIKVQKNRLTLNLPADILNLNKTVVFKNGAGLFRVYNKLNDFLEEGKFATLKPLEEMYTFKEFSSSNVSQQKTLIKFASDGVDGAWDIATMSMRGIQSCQAWNGAYSRCLVGSIVDPCVGIIYLTTGKKFNEYGSKMTRRCTVKLAIDKDKKPFILLDRMYPSYDEASFDTFARFIKEKTANKLEVYYGPNCYNKMQGWFIPLSPIVKGLSQEFHTYRDTAIPHKTGFVKLKKYIKDNFKDIASLQPASKTEMVKETLEVFGEKAIKKVLEISDHIR